MTLCRSPEAAMPAIALIEDLRAAEKEGLSIYDMPNAFFRTRITDTVTFLMKKD